MNQTGYVGGAVAGPAGERVAHNLAAGAGHGAALRFHRRGDSTMFLDVRGRCLTTHGAGDVMLLLRGYALPRGAERLPDQSALAEELCEAYRRSDELPLGRLEGSFTLVLVDGRKERLLAFRNLVGTGFTYYAQAHGGLLLASNLAELAGLLDAHPRPNRDVLPVFFLYRSVPGRETLFDGIYRLMPGELLSYGAHGLVVEQRQTFADLEEPGEFGAESVDRLEEAMSRVMTDCATIDPQAANLLSGGTDSSFIQAHWNPALAVGPPRSAAIVVDHARTRCDRSYARSAAAHFGTSHNEFLADGSYGHYLTTAVAATGEPPNHVQSAYFGPLARFMVSQGIATGLCGEGADSLFGTDYAWQLQRAARFRRWVPFRAVRHGLAQLADALSKETTAHCLRLADYPENLAHRGHPVNEIAAFTDWPAVERCFGAPAVSSATAYRRRLLEQYAIPRQPLDQVHAAGFLGEAMETASLWTASFEREGAALLCPYMDSRLLRLAVNTAPRYRFSSQEPKWAIKQALCRHAPRELVHRPKLGFGQPIFEWLSPAGQLRPLVDAIGQYDFVNLEVLEEAKARPNWFLYSLLCYDLWHKLFIERSISAASEGPADVVVPAHRS